MHTAAHSAHDMSHQDVLNVLAKGDPQRLKPFSETLLDQLENIQVEQSRTGLVMLPMRDTAQGTAFHLGEILVSEAHITMGAHQGYGMRQGRDLEAAMAMAVIDLALAARIKVTECLTFLADEARHQAEADAKTLHNIQATRVDMETF